MRWNEYGKWQRQVKKEQFASLLHHVNIDLLRLPFFAIKRNDNPGRTG
jgi:hypothetical protein